MAEISRPGTFDLLILIEPIVFPPPFERSEPPLVEEALRRRSRFPNRAAARARFVDKDVFSDWDPAAMDAYVDGALEERSGEWVLRCTPEDEADVYRGGSAHGAYQRLAEIDVPVLLLAGEHSSTFGGEYVEDLRSRFRRASSVILPGAGHFVPMEQPGSVAERMVEFIRREPE
jgi:pimeloyl-ACP methyl ester carboxylesterase